MKLAEALILRSDLQNRMEQIKDRLNNNILMQEDNEPSENPYELLKEYMYLQNQLSNIVKSINKTNNNIKFDEEKTLSDALVEREELINNRKILSFIVEKGSEKQDRYSRSEIKYVSFVDIKKIQKQADDFSKKYRELDTKIQRINWEIDLI